MTKSGRKAFSYIRFSSAKQATGDSLRRQTALRDAYIKREGLILDTSLTLQDLGVSAWKGDNASTGDLSAFLDMCRKGRIPSGSVFIVEHLDRLSGQQVRKALQLFLGILEAGVTIVTLEPEREYDPTDDNNIALIEVLLHFAAANDKSEQLSKRLLHTWAEKRKARQPLTSWTPAWIKLKNGKFELIPEHARVIKKIFKWATEGYGDLRIVKRLNDERVPVISGHATWTHAYVTKILKTPAVFGQFHPRVTKTIKIGNKEVRKLVPTGEVWEDYFPAVISREQFYKLRAIRQTRVRQRGPVGDQVANLFTGILFNARDGQPFHRIVKNVPRLISASFRNGLSGGDTQSIPYGLFEKIFLLVVGTELKLEDIAGNAEAIVDPEVGLNAELDEIDRKIEQVSP